MEESPQARVVFLSRLIRGSTDREPEPTLLLKDSRRASEVRDLVAEQIRYSPGPQVLVLDLGGFALTPAGLQELLLPLAQRIRGGEYGTVRLVISTADAAVADFVRYMAQAHQLPLYLTTSPLELSEAIPIGNLTKTESSTLDAVFTLGGQVTASMLAEREGLQPSAATNRLVNLDREGYLLRLPRGRREGDVYIEPRSATSRVFDDPYEVSRTTTDSG